MIGCHTCGSQTQIKGAFIHKIGCPEKADPCTMCNLTCTRPCDRYDRWLKQLSDFAESFGKEGAA